MTILTCDVRNCSNNKEHHCTITYIEVDGTDATSSTKTACANFTASSIVASNSPHHPQQDVKIYCTASGCIYNDYLKCTKPDIHVSGSTTASCSHDTECASFICK